MSATILSAFSHATICRPMRVAVVGSGGVGGYFGGRLASAGTEVVFIARGAHLAALKTRGLRIQSPLGDVDLPTVNATDDPEAVGRVDVAFFTVKLLRHRSGKRDSAASNRPRLRSRPLSERRRERRAR